MGEGEEETKEEKRREEAGRGKGIGEAEEGEGREEGSALLGCFCLLNAGVVVLVLLVPAGANTGVIEVMKTFYCATLTTKGKIRASCSSSFFLNVRFIKSPGYYQTLKL